MSHKLYDQTLVLRLYLLLYDFFWSLISFQTTEKTQMFHLKENHQYSYALWFIPTGVDLVQLYHRSVLTELFIELRLKNKNRIQTQDLTGTNDPVSGSHINSCRKLFAANRKKEERINLRICFSSRGSSQKHETLQKRLDLLWGIFQEWWSFPELWLVSRHFHTCWSQSCLQCRLPWWYAPVRRNQG